MCPMALISAIMVTTLFEIEHPCDTSKNGLYHRGMIYSLIDLSQCRSLAIGICLCGIGSGTFALAPISNMILEKYGWRNVMRKGENVCLIYNYLKNFLCIGPTLVSVVLAF